MGMLSMGDMTLKLSGEKKEEKKHFSLYLLIAVVLIPSVLFEP